MNSEYDHTLVVVGSEQKYDAIIETEASDLEAVVETCKGIIAIKIMHGTEDVTREFTSIRLRSRTKGWGTYNYCEAARGNILWKFPARMDK